MTNTVTVIFGKYHLPYSGQFLLSPGLSCPVHEGSTAGETPAKGELILQILPQLQGEEM